MNCLDFRDAVLEEARRAVIAISKKSGIEEMMIETDNCKSHNSTKTRKRLEEFQVARLPHPPYSPDISLRNFCFIRWSKDVIQGQRFLSPDHVRAFLLDLWQNVDPSTLISVYHDWIEGLEHAAAMNGEYESKSATEIRLYSADRAGAGA
jgi:histone-lysine N-methyltransferase SETMAR